MSSEQTPFNQGELEESAAELERLADSLEYFKLAANLIEGAISLSTDLESERRPDISEYTFSFDGSAVRYLPKAIREYVELLGRLDEIQIEVSHAEGDPTSRLTVRFDFGNDEYDNPRVYNANRPGSSELPQPSDQFVSGGSPNDVSRIPQSELNMCVASLCFPSKDGDFSQYSGLSPNNGSIYEPLVESLRKNAPNFFSKIHYTLESLEGDMSGSYDYAVDDGEVIEATLRRVVHNELSISEDGTPIDDETAVETSISVVDGVSVKFYRSETACGVGGRKPMPVDREDYLSGLEFIAYHKNKLSPVQEEPFYTTEIDHEADGED